MGLFSTKSEHPLADIKSAKHIIENLPKMDAQKSIQELSEWIETLHGTLDETSNDSLVKQANAGNPLAIASRSHQAIPMKLDTRFSVLRLLDEAARPYERKLVREFFSSSQLNTFQENRLWSLLSGFYQHTSQAYYEILLGIERGERGSGALKSALKTVYPWLASRGLTALMNQIKYASVRYTPVNSLIAVRFVDYYNFLNTSNLLDEPAEGHSGNSPLSFRQQIAGTLLWWATGTGTFKKSQIHIANQIILFVSPQITLGADPSPESQWVFRFGADRSGAEPVNPPIRYQFSPQSNAETIGITSLVLYLGATKTKVPMEGILAILQKNLIPEALTPALGGDFTSESIQEVAQRLLTSWTEPPPARRQVRHSVNVKMNIVKGLSGLLDQIGVGMSFGDIEGIETWEAEDISFQGFRCILGASQCDGIKIGGLIGYQPENVSHWGAAIIRRIRRIEQDKMDVGVELIGQRARGVQLSELASLNVELQDHAPGILLTLNGQKEGMARVLTRPEAFHEEHHLQMKIMGEANKEEVRAILWPLKQTIKGDDYDLVSYRQMTQMENADQEWIGGTKETDPSEKTGGFVGKSEGSPGNGLDNSLKLEI